MAALAGFESEVPWGKLYRKNVLNGGISVASLLESRIKCSIQTRIISMSFITCALLGSSS